MDDASTALRSMSQDNARHVECLTAGRHAAARLMRMLKQLGYSVALTPMNPTVYPDAGVSSRGCDMAWQGCGPRRSDRSARGEGGLPAVASAGQQHCKQNEIQNGECEQAMRGAPIVLAAPGQLHRERNEHRSADGGRRRRRSRTRAALRP